MSRRYRAPLVIFTPKSLLRLPRAMSHPDDLSSGRFRTVLDDPGAAARPQAVRSAILCSGKVYYDLLEERLRRQGDGDLTAALLRVEQLYPWPGARIASLLGRFTSLERVVWCQEEPRNMGAWSFVYERLPDLLPSGLRLDYAGRAPSASIAAGSPRVHKREQSTLVAEAFGK
jgi:2-oxoglutarate dehydrogenase E1 component